MYFHYASDRLRHIVKITVLLAAVCIFMIAHMIHAGADTTENLALNASVEVSRETKGKDHQLVTDGDTKSQGGSAKMWNVQAGEYIIIDLGESKRFNQLKLYEFNHQRLKGYTLEISQNGKDWTFVQEADDLIVTKSESWAILSGEITFKPVDARYIKLTIKDIYDPETHKTMAYISEIEVYHSPDVRPDTSANTKAPEPAATHGGIATLVSMDGSISNINNLAFQKDVSVSRETAGKEHGKITDGNAAASQSAETWNVQAGDYAVIDFGQNVSFNQLIVYEMNFQRLKGYILESSMDAKQWDVIADSDALVAPDTVATNHHSGTIDIPMTNARYVKLTIKEISDPDPKKTTAYVEEIKIFDSEQTNEEQVNLALHREVVSTFSYSTPNVNPAKIVDGDPGTHFASNSSKNETSGSFQIDLGAAAHMNHIVVQEGLNRIKEHRLWISPDGEEWTLVSQGAGIGDRMDVLFEPTLARYVKLEVPKTEAGIRMKEISVFNSSDKPTYPNGDPPAPRVMPELPEPVVVDPVPYAKEDFHVYLFIGQSNMNGRDVIPFEDMIVLDRAFLFNADGKWEYAQPYPKAGSKFTDVQGYNRYSSVDPDSMNGMNPAVSFARAMMLEVPDAGFGIVSNARGGTSIRQWQKGSGENLYEEAVNRAKQALEHGTLKAIFWLQGEGDANTKDYLKLLNNVASGIREELGVSHDEVPFIASQNPERYTVNNERIQLIGSEVPNSDWISSDGTSTIDQTHFDAASQRILGIRYAVQTLQKVYGRTVTEEQLLQAVYPEGTAIEHKAPSDLPIKVFLDGEEMDLETAPLVRGGRLFVPLRAVYEALGGEVSWDPDVKGISVKTADRTIVMQIGSENATINGEYASIDVAPMIEDGTAFLPLRFVGESFGIQTNWDQTSNVVTINSK